ncbi:MAG TPA: ABC transporter ATP-binding protein, partial [Blastocatellia bacterium]|nr:ABC transporter ATP-binding protein [Blastocatellia bacterium]
MDRVEEARTESDKVTDRANLCRTAISVKGIARSYGEQAVLSDVSFDIAEGELLVLLGPSGSGKTTLLRIIAGLDQSDAGEIILRGERIDGVAPQRRNLGIVFQEQALFRRMTVEQNIAFGLRVQKFKRSSIESVVEEMLSLIHLQAHRKKYPSQLSGGERQRVAVARALAYEPGAVLFDEPFSALDAVTRVELRRDVRVLLRSLKLPALFITHDQEEALDLADRIAILNNGRIEQIGTPFEIYNHPQTEFVATFLGAANVLLGRLRDGKVAIGPLRLRMPPDAPSLSERQAVKIVFRPEDVVLGFQPQLLNTPYYLGRGVVESVSYAGPNERVVVRLVFRGMHDTTVE